MFDDQLCSKLLELESSPEREAFVMMDRIYSPGISSAVIRSEDPDAIERTLIPEVGIFGVFLR